MAGGSVGAVVGLLGGLSGSERGFLALSGGDMRVVRGFWVWQVMAPT